MNRYLLAGLYVLLLWSSYRAGRDNGSRRAVIVTGGAALACLSAADLARHPGLRAVGGLAVTCAVFVALPLVTGCYLRQHQRLVAALEQQNRQLRRNTELAAGQERLNERLRIARDMHDTLGHRLSLLSVQAAALEVSGGPPRHREAVTRLASAARAALDDLHEVVGLLRGRDPARAGEDITEQIAALTRDARAAGLRVTLVQRGHPGPVTAAAAQAAYRTAEEGLTNAARHAPGEPVAVHVTWEPGALLLSVTNPVVTSPVVTGPAGGHGLRGLGERVGSAGGTLGHQVRGGRFCLSATLPAGAGDLPGGDPPGPARPARAAVLGVAAAILMFAVLPAAVLLGAR